MPFGLQGQDLKQLAKAGAAEAGADFLLATTASGLQPLLGSLPRQAEPLPFSRRERSPAKEVRSLLAWLIKPADSGSVAGWTTAAA